MNPRELVDHIRTGPAELVLLEPLRLRRRRRSNPCDFNEFLQALLSSETIRSVTCDVRQRLGIARDQWVLLVQTLGRIRDIHNLRLYCPSGSGAFDPFQAVADAVSNAHSLHKLHFDNCSDNLPSDQSGMIALADALREHPTLQEFTWVDFCPRVQDATAINPVLWALPACPHLRKVSITTKCASANTMKKQLQLHKATDLYLLLGKENWLAVANEIRRGRCNVQTLTLAMLQVTRSEATEAVKAVARAILLDQHLEHLTLKMENGFTDEAGVALAEALLTVNKTLRKITLSVDFFIDYFDDPRPHKTDTLGVQAYEAFSAMLRVNTSLVLELPPFEFETDGVDERLFESYNQMVIECRLNQVGRGRLMASRQTTRQEYTDALNGLNSDSVDDPPAFRVSCLYSLLRLHPAVCMS
jgi:hypothetical protein